MAIDYRNEVDSGFDRKIIVENTIKALLNMGFSPEIIIENSDFNPRHLEMLGNLQDSHYIKEDEIKTLYDHFLRDDLIEESYSEGSSLGIDQYATPIHAIQELYPMGKEEEKEKFSKRDQLNKTIDKLKNAEKKKIIKESDKILNKIVKFKAKFPVIDNIINLVNELDELMSKGENSSEQITALFHKYGFDQKKMTTLNLIYNDYMALVNKLNEYNEKNILCEQGKVMTDEIQELTMERNDLNNELFQRNIKLANYYIRSRYKSLLVDSEDLYSTMVSALYEAVLKFDVKKGYAFSTYAYKGMDFAIHKNFKDLTGYSWKNYWAKIKIQKELEVVSELLGRNAGISDLIDLGFLNMRENTAAALLSGTLLESAVYGDEPFSEKNTYPTTFEDYEQIDEYEDAKYGNNATDGDEVENTAEATTMSETLESILVRLTDRERLMVILKFGLDPHKYMTEDEQKYFGAEAKVRTMNEISNIFNVSTERVHMVIAKALRKLRHPVHSKKLKGYYI